MSYKVVIEPLAESDAVEYAHFIGVENKNPDAAEKWLRELEERIRDLSEMPKRFRVIDEQTFFKLELRQFLHHSHRVIFHISEATATVHVLRIYHAHRRSLLPLDI